MRATLPDAGAERDAGHTGALHDLLRAELYCSRDQHVFLSLVAANARCGREQRWRRAKRS
jgi:hypothetical protein